jgi:hypothetical protein
MSLTKVSYSMISGAPANPLDFGAVGDGVTDDTVALQTFINYCRDNNVTGSFPQDGKTFRITSSLVTQHTGTFAVLTIDFNSALIVADFSGSAAIIVTGGSVEQNLLNVRLSPSSTYAMNVSYSNADSLSHGISVTNTIVKISGIIIGFRGHGYLHFDTASNSNTSEWDLIIGTCNYGAYFRGDVASNNLSVCRANFRIQNCAAYGFFAEINCTIRAWDAWIYAENNCQATTAVAGVTVQRSVANNWWIYSEQSNAANEIDFSLTTNTANLIFTARNNKDVINLDIAYSNQVMFGGKFVGPFKYEGNGTAWTPSLGGSTTNPTFTGLVSSGYWTRLGNIVYAFFTLSWSAATGGSGILRVGNFPIPPAVLATVPGTVTLSNINTPASTVSVAFQGVENGGNYGHVICTLDTGAATNIATSDLQAGAASLTGSCWYFV